MEGDKKEKWKREESHGVGGRTDKQWLKAEDSQKHAMKLNL
jgi:hypothetical protein